VNNALQLTSNSVLIPGNTTGPALPSPASPSASPHTATSIPTQTSTPIRGLSTRVYAGIGVGAAVGFVLLAILGTVLFKKYKYSRQRPTETGKSEQTITGIQELEAREHFAELSNS